MAGTASAKVFSTTELHELILLQLPVAQVLLAQRVSKQWMGCISSSPKLQSSLCLRSVRQDTSADTPDGHLEIMEDGESVRLAQAVCFASRA